MPEEYVIGVDFGTDSVRSLLVNANNGKEIATAVFFYPRWKQGRYCDPAANRFRQHPLDYIEGLEQTIRSCLQQAGVNTAAGVRAISVDTTGSTPVAVDRTGTPLSLLPGMEENPNAMFVLWKDHTSIREATELNKHAERYQPDYLKYVGGIYSSEWFWAKLLHILREDEQVRANIYSWVEHCDWIPFLLTGGHDAKQIRRGVCAAGHKSLWAAEFGGLPPDHFFSEWDPLLKGFTQQLFTETFDAAQPAGTISPEWAERLGLSPDVTIGIGAFDCHMGAVGGQIEPYHLSKVMGTSTCDMLVAPLDETTGVLVKGICGQVPGSIIPGMLGMEAGQSAFGDAYAWLRKLLLWPMEYLATDNAGLLAELHDSLIPALSKAAAALPVTEQDEWALDWLNGRRTPDANQELKGLIGNLNLGTDAPRLFRAIAEATCFGARAIVERFREERIQVKGLIGLGGVAKKSPYIMQMMADVIQMPIRIHKSDQTCALGAAMFAATAAGIYSRVEEAMQAMGPGFENTYQPDKAKAAHYEKRYRQYRRWGGFAAEKSE